MKELRLVLIGFLLNSLLPGLCTFMQLVRWNRLVQTLLQELLRLLNEFFMLLSPAVQIRMLVV